MPMVQCDTCTLWVHVPCVGLTPLTLPLGEYTCPTCVAKHTAGPDCEGAGEVIRTKPPAVEVRTPRKRARQQRACGSSPGSSVGAGAMASPPPPSPAHAAAPPGGSGGSRCAGSGQRKRRLLFDGCVDWSWQHAPPPLVAPLAVYRQVRRRLSFDRSAFVNVPDDVMVHVLSWLPWRERPRTGLLSKRWLRVSRAPVFWRKFHAPADTVLGITDATASAVARAGGNQLCELDLSCCVHLSVKSARALRDAGCCEALRTLSLAHCVRMTDAVFVPLRACTALETLDLSYCSRVRASPRGPFAKFGAAAARLRSLNLSSTGAKLSCVRALPTGLRRLNVGACEWIHHPGSCDAVRLRCPDLEVLLKGTNIAAAFPNLSALS